MVFNSERALIGAILQDPQAVEACGSLGASMFHDGLLGRIFLEFQRAADFGYRLTPVELAQKLPDVPEQVLLDSLRECADSSISSAAAGQYAAAVVNGYKAREASRVINSVRFQPDGVETQIGSLVSSLEGLLDSQQAEVCQIKDIVSREAEQHFCVRPDKMLHLGFPRLDGYLGGLERGDIMVIGARPAVGKSAFVTQILLNMAQAGKRVILFSLEMSSRQVYERMASRLSGIDLQRIRLAEAFLRDEGPRFESANETLRNLDIWISDGNKSVSQIRGMCRHMQPDCIIVDYLQLVRPERRYGNRAAEVGEISKAFKAVAMELHCPIILLSQLNRLSEGAKEPGMSELRESGDIEQDASQILLLWNLDNIDGSKKGIKVAKNRQGSLGKVYLDFSGATMAFEESHVQDYTGFKRARETPFDEREKVSASSCAKEGLK